MPGSHHTASLVYFWGMALFETIADRRIREGRAAGAFDNLPGAGKPIPDLGQERPAGWWGTRAVKTERDKIRFEDLTVKIRAAKPLLWRLATVDEVFERVAELNAEIDAYNAKTLFQSVERLTDQTVVNQWRHAQDHIRRRSG